MEGSCVGVAEGGAGKTMLQSCPFKPVSDQKLNFPLSLWAEAQNREGNDVSWKRAIINVRVTVYSAATFVVFDSVQEDSPLYQVRNLCKDYYVHIYQPSPNYGDYNGPSRAITVAPRSQIRDMTQKPAHIEEK